MKLIRYLPSSLLILVILTICLRASFFFSVGWILLFISVPHPLSVSSLCQLLSCFLFSWYDQSLSIIWRRGNWGGGVDGVFLCLDRIYLIPPYWTNKQKNYCPSPPLSLAVNWQSLFYGSFLILCWRQLPPPLVPLENYRVHPKILQFWAVTWYCMLHLLSQPSMEHAMII